MCNGQLKKIEAEDMTPASPDTDAGNTETTGTYEGQAETPGSVRSVSPGTGNSPEGKNVT